MIWVAFKVVLGIPVSEPLLATQTRKRMREVLDREYPVSAATWTEPDDEGSIMRWEGNPFVGWKIKKVKLS